MLLGVQGGGFEALRYRSGISLRECYAMSGTDLAYGGISLRTYDALPLRCYQCCAMSGTDLAYGATMCGTGASMCGTEISSVWCYQCGFVMGEGAGVLCLVSHLSAYAYAYAPNSTCLRVCLCA
eukprot:1590864-Rhodomonas_salina.1